MDSLRVTQVWSAVIQRGDWLRAEVPIFVQRLEGAPQCSTGWPSLQQLLKGLKFTGEERTRMRSCCLRRE